MSDMLVAIRYFLLSFLFVIAFGANAWSQVTWDDGAGDGLWSSGANWSGDAVPGDDDDVVIEGDYRVTVTSSDSCKSITMITNNTGNDSVTLTISSGARLGISDSIILNDRKQNNNAALVTVDGGSTLYVGGNFRMVKDNSKKSNNDMFLTIRDDNSLVDIDGDLLLTYTSTTTSNDIGLVMEDDSRLEVNNITIEQNNTVQDQTMFSINENGVAGDSAVIDVTGDFTINNVGGKQDFRITMDYESRINVGNDFLYNGSNGWAFRLTMDRDAAFHVTNDFTATKAGDQEFRIHLNQTTAGSAADAQLVIGGDMNINITNGDEVEIFLSEHSDITVAGLLDFDVGSLDDNADNVSITLSDSSKWDVAGIADIDIANTAKSGDFLITLGDQSEWEIGGAMTIDFTNSDAFELDLSGSAVLDVDGSFSFDNETSSNTVFIDMDNTSAMTVAGDFTVQQDDAVDLTIELDEDASLAVTGNMSLIKTANNHLELWLNQNADGSGADAQITVGGDLSFTKTDGDELQVYLNNDADIAVTGALIMTTSNGDDDADFHRFDLNNESAVTIGTDFTLNMTDANSLDFDLLLANTASFSVGNDFDWTNSAGNTSVTLSESATLTIPGNWTNTMSGGVNYTITLSDDADLDLTGDFYSFDNSSNGTFLVDMDNNATWDIGQDFVLVQNNGSGGIQFELDRDAALTIADSLFLTYAQSSPMYIYMNNNADGSSADAQLSVGGAMYVDKNDGDEFQIYLRNDADLLISEQFRIETNNGDDDSDELDFDLQNSSRISVGDSLVIDMVETSKSFDFFLTIQDDADFLITDSYVYSNSGGDQTITMSENADLSIGEKWTVDVTDALNFNLTMTDNADLDVSDDFAYTNGNSGSNVTIAMSNNATWDIGQDMSLISTVGGTSVHTITLDHDAALTLGDSLYLFTNADGNIFFYLNNSADGAAADAQITIPGAFYIDKNNGDDLRFYLRNDADITVTGQFRIETTNGDDDSDDTDFDLDNNSSITVGDSLVVEQDESSKSLDFYMSIEDDADFIINSAFTFANSGGNQVYTLSDNADFSIGDTWSNDLSGGEDLTITMTENADLDVGNDFSMFNSNTGSAIKFDMYQNSTWDISQDMALNTTAGGDASHEISLNHDAALTLGDSLYLHTDGNGTITFILNDSAAGSADHGQITIPGALHIDKDNGDELLFYMYEDANINITGEFLVETTNSDDNNDQVRIEMENDSRIDASSMTMDLVEPNRTIPLRVFLENNAILDITNDVTWNNAGGDSDLQLYDDSEFNIGGDWSLDQTSGEDFEIEMKGNGDLNLTGDFDFNNTSTGGSFTIDMDQASTFDVGQDMIIDHIANGSSSTLTFALDSDAVLNIADTLAINFDNDGTLNIELNENVNGAAADAQLTVGGDFYVNKDDGDQLTFRVENDADFLITGNAVIETSGVDDNGDNHTINFTENGVLSVGGDFTIDQNENNNSNFTFNLVSGGNLSVGGDLNFTQTNAQHFEMDLSGDGIVSIGDDFTFSNSSSSGYFVLDLNDDAQFTVTNDLLVTNNSAADDDSHTRIDIDADATMSVGDSLLMNHVQDNSVQLRMNRNQDGSAADAQLAVGGSLIMIMDGGDNVQLLMDQDADLTVGNDLIITIEDTDGTDDDGEIELNNNAKIDVEGSVLYTTNNSNTGADNDIRIDMNNSSQFDIGPAAGPYTTDSLHITLNGGSDLNFNLSTSAVMNVYGNLRVSKPAGTDAVIDLNDNTQLNVFGDLTMDNSENNSDQIRFDLESSAVLDVDGNIDMRGVTNSGLHEIELNDNSKLLIAGNFLRSDAPNNYGLIDVNSANVEVTFDGDGGQVFPDLSGAGTDEFQLINVIINNSFGTSPQLTMAATTTFTGTMTFTDGVLASTASEMLIFAAGSSVSGGSDASYVDGPVRKVGNTAFTFPTGDDGFYAPISISAPGDVADAFDAEFFRADPDGSFSRSSRATSLNTISSVEHWILDRTNGSANVQVTLSWHANSGVSDISDLRVSRWDGSEWQDHGNNSTTGDATAGTVTSNTITSFSPFALASSTNNNTLPIELLSFEAELVDGQVDLLWETATEINNDFFTIERTTDLQTIETVTRMEGAGTSTRALKYETVDFDPHPGVSYYRLRQTDFNGTTTVTDWQRIYNEQGDAAETSLSVLLFPNPLRNGNSLKLDVQNNVTGSDFEITIYDLLGQLRFNRNFGGQPESSLLEIPLPELEGGTYLVRMTNGHEVIDRKLVVQ